MDLNLTVMAYNQQAPQQPMSYTWHQGSGSFGRAEDNDWVLPDPQNFVSGKHGLIIYENNEYYLSDISTNGIFLNHSLKKLPKYERVLLKAEDHLRLGLYELLVKLVPNFSLSEYKERPDSQKNSTNWPEESTYRNPASTTSMSRDLPKDSIRIPANWPEELVQPEELHSQEISYSENSDLPKDSMRIPINWPEESTQLGDLPNSQENSASVCCDPPNSSMITPINWPTEELRAQLRPHSCSEQQAHPASSYENFFKGCGVNFTNNSLYSLPDMEHLGRLMRIAIQGTFDLLNSRNEVKSAFHMEQSIIQRKGNNPLKFSVNANEALNRLLLSHVDANLLAEDALTEAFEDLRVHQLAVLAGMHSALKQVLTRFEPAKLIERLEEDNPISANIPYQREHKLWNRFEELYAQLEEECTEDFQRLFGLEFVRAYQAQIIQLKKGGADGNG